MKSKSIFTFLFGLLILFLHHGPSAARSCQSLTGKCSTPHCGNGFAAVAFDVGCNEGQYCCIAGDFNEVQSFRNRFDEIKTSSHYKTKVFILAQEIKDVLDAATESRDVLKDLRILKSEFPETVRYIVWGDEVALCTKKYNEYLYAHYIRRGPRRLVFTWKPATKRGSWKFESRDGGKTFSIEYAEYEEYLSAYVTNYGEDLRNINMSKPPCDDKSCFWQIEYMGDSEIRIKNVMYPEYLFADSSAYDENRRSIFTGTLTLDARIWKVVLV